MKKIALLAALLLAAFSFAACEQSEPVDSNESLPSDSGASSQTESETEELTPEEAVRFYAEHHYINGSPEPLIKAFVSALNDNRFDVLAEMQTKGDNVFDYNQLTGKVVIKEASYKTSKGDNGFFIYRIKYTVSESAVDGIDVGKNNMSVFADPPDGDRYVLRFMPGKNSIPGDFLQTLWTKTFDFYVLNFDSVYPNMEDEPEKLMRFLAFAAHRAEGEFTAEYYNNLMYRTFGIPDYYAEAGEDGEGRLLVRDVYGNVLPLDTSDYESKTLFEQNKSIREVGMIGNVKYPYADVVTYDDDFGLHAVSVDRYLFKHAGTFRLWIIEPEK